MFLQGTSPPGMFSSIWRLFWLSHLGRVLLASVGGGRGHCSTPCGAQVSPTTEGDSVPIVSGAEVERPWVGRGAEPESLVPVLVPRASAVSLEKLLFVNLCFLN